jgi:hypothetical protein
MTHDKPRRRRLVAAIPLLLIASVLAVGPAEADPLPGDAVGIAAGTYHTCVLKANGNVDCYGYNSSGQAADYLGGDAVGIATGGWTTCVLKANGNVDCSGSVDYTGGDAVGIAVGGYHTCVLKSNRNVDCYGSNDYGQAEDWQPAAGWSVPGGASHAVPVTPVTTPPVEVPATCTLDACTEATPEQPIGTPEVPVPEVCVLPVVLTVICVGPTSVPEQDLTSTPPVPAICSVATPACIGPITLLPGMTLVTTPYVLVDISLAPGFVSYGPDASDTIGPFHHDVYVPVLDMTVPVDLCPNTCPNPAGAHGMLGGTLVVTVVVDSTTKTEEIPLPPVVF